MQPIRSKLGFRRVLTWLGYVYILLTASWLLSIVIPLFSLHDSIPYIMLGITLSFFGMAFYGFWWEYNNVHQVALDNEKIIIGRLGTFYWRDVEQVDLHAYKSFGKSGYKGVLLTFKDHKPIYLFNYAYRNMGEIRAFIKEHVVDKM